MCVREREIEEQRDYRGEWKMFAPRYPTVLYIVSLQLQTRG